MPSPTSDRVWDILTKLAVPAVLAVSAGSVRHEIRTDRNARAIERLEAVNASARLTQIESTRFTGEQAAEQRVAMAQLTEGIVRAESERVLAEIRELKSMLLAQDERIRDLERQR